MIVQEETIKSRKKWEYSQNMDTLLQKNTTISSQKQYQSILDSSVVVTTESTEHTMVSWQLFNLEGNKLSISFFYKGRNG